MSFNLLPIHYNFLIPFSVQLTSFEKIFTHRIHSCSINEEVESISHYLAMYQVIHYNSGAGYHVSRQSHGKGFLHGVHLQRVPDHNVSFGYNQVVDPFHPRVGPYREDHILIHLQVQEKSIGGCFLKTVLYHEDF